MNYFYFKAIFGTFRNSTDIFLDVLSTIVSKYCTMNNYACFCTSLSNMPAGSWPVETPSIKINRLGHFLPCAIHVKMRNIFAIVLLLFADVKIYSKIFVIIHSIFIIHVYLPIRSATVYKVCLHFMGGLKREYGTVYYNIWNI